MALVLKSSRRRASYVLETHIPNHVGLPAQNLLLSIVLATCITSSAYGSNDAVLMARCARFHAYEAGIAEDLLPWYDDEGISEELMDHTIAERSLENKVPGLPLCILGGKLYVINGKAQNLNNAWYWQADNLVVYAHALQRLVERWGPALPDVELVLESSDVPHQDLGEGPGRVEGADGAKQGGEAGSEGPPWGVWSKRHGRLPVMRHCKAESSPDITVPIFHFYTVDYDTKFLAMAESLNREHPWERRLPLAFGAGTNYHRAQDVPSTTRSWDGSLQGLKVEMVRDAFSRYLAEELRHPNITFEQTGVPLHDWVKYRMLLHVDGISCSSRLWQLLALGSVVLREQSGYFAFYDKLLSKFTHYLPFWSHRPREVVWAYNWVIANEAAARGIASRGQHFARKYLNAEAVECFWALLLHQYARLQRFTPGQRVGRPPEQFSLVPVEEWLEAQEGKVESWNPGYIKARGLSLNLLPKSRQT